MTTTTAPAPARYLLDTNHAGAIFRDNHAFLARLAAAAGAEFGLCVPSVGELYFMAYNSARVAENEAKLTTMLSRFRLYEFDLAAAAEFGRIRTEQRRAGRPIPPIDAQIAAVARLHGLTVLSADAHFTAVAGLRVENWLTP